MENGIKCDMESSQTTLIFLITEFLHKRNKIDLIYLVSNKAFEMMPCLILVVKWEKLGSSKIIVR